MTSRIRQRGGFKYNFVRTGRYIDSSCAHTTWTQYVNTPVGMEGRLEYMTDDKTVGFEKRVKKGEIIMNPLSQRISETTIYPGEGPHFELTNPISCPATGKRQKHEQEGPWFETYALLKYTAITDGRLPAIPVLGPSEIDALVRDTCTNCWANRSLADSNLFESVAEYKSTVKTIGDVLVRTHSTLKKWLRNPIKGASDIHLMIRYAIMPGIKDIDSIVKGIDKPKGIVRKTTRAKQTLFRSKSSTDSYNGSSFQVNWSLVSNDEVEVRAMSIDEYNATLAANIGFTDNGLLITPWELIPWSFVIDWFVNVGNFLQALAPMQGRKHLGSCYVTRRTYSTLYTATTTVAATNWQINRPITGSVLSTEIRVNRSPTLAPPSLTIKPNFKLDEYLRAADALALVIQLISRVASKHPT
jgi:hypothetical protein